MTTPRFITIQKSDEDNFLLLAVDKISTIAMRPPAKCGADGATATSWVVVIQLRGPGPGAVGTSVVAYVGNKTGDDDGYADALEAFTAFEKLLGSVDMTGAVQDGAGLLAYVIRRHQEESDG